VATYATAAEARTYTGLSSAELPDSTAERLLEQAERDVDYACGGFFYPDTGLMFDLLAVAPSTAALTVGQKRALSRATCAQVEYRLAKGEEFFVLPQYELVSGPDFEHRGQLDYIGPKVYRELAGSGLRRQAVIF
jgi:hypothetical protein